MGLCGSKGAESVAPEGATPKGSAAKYTTPATVHPDSSPTTSPTHHEQEEVEHEEEKPAELVYRENRKVGARYLVLSLHRTDSGEGFECDAFEPSTVQNYKGTIARADAQAMATKDNRADLLDDANQLKFLGWLCDHIAVEDGNKIVFVAAARGGRRGSIDGPMARQVSRTTGDGSDADGSGGDGGAADDSVQVFRTSRNIGGSYGIVTMDHAGGQQSGNIVIRVYVPLTSLHSELELTPDDVKAAVSEERLLKPEADMELMTYLATRLTFKPAPGGKPTDPPLLGILKAGEEPPATDGDGSDGGAIESDEGRDLHFKRTVKLRGAYYICSVDVVGNHCDISCYAVRDSAAYSVRVDLRRVRKAFMKGTKEEREVGAPGRRTALLQHLLSLLEIVVHDLPADAPADASAEVELVIAGVTGQGAVEVKGFRRSVKVGDSYLLVFADRTKDGDIDVQAFDARTHTHYECRVDAEAVNIIARSHPDGTALLHPAKLHRLLTVVADGLILHEVDGVMQLHSMYATHSW